MTKTKEPSNKYWVVDKRAVLAMRSFFFFVGGFMNYYIADEAYLNYLRQFEPKIPYSDYGEYGYKPSFGPLFTVNDLVYITHLTHYSYEKYYNRPESRFIYYTRDIYGNLCSVVNLDAMFPIPEKMLERLDFKEMSKVRKFHSSLQERKYVDYLKMQLDYLNQLKDFKEVAKDIYARKIVFPNEVFDKENEHSTCRCIDFKMLEQAAELYMTCCSEIGEEFEK